MKSRTRAASKEIAAHIRVPKECPDILLGISPCRSGSTAQLRVFAPSVYQPIKNILRYRLADEKISYTIPNDTPHLFIKETIGPYTPEESTINPLEILHMAGVPAEKIKLLVTLRSPLATITSWNEQFVHGGTKEMFFANAIRAYHTVDHIKAFADSMGIENYTFVYETLKDNPGAEILNRFAQLGLPVSQQAYKDWKTLPRIGTPESKIIFPPELEQYQSSGEHKIHQTTENSSGFIYYPKGIEKVYKYLTRTDIEVLSRLGVFNIYEEFTERCIQDLGIGITPPTEVEDYLTRDSLMRTSEGRHQMRK